MPLKVTVLVLAVNVPPLFVQLPLTAKLYAPPIVNMALLLIVILLHNPPAAPMVGWFPPDGMVTFVVAVGIPPHQLEALFQSVLVVPSQVPGLHEVELTLTIPVVAAK